MLMATLTIEKAALAATDEHRGPSVEKLAQALGEFREVGGELEAYRSKSARAGLTMSEALEDSALTEEETAEKISYAENLKSVYAGRAANLERKSAVLLEQLKAAMTAAMSEQTLQVRGLVERRREKIISGVYEVLGAYDPIVRGLIARATRICPAIQELECLTPGDSYGVRSMPPEGVVATAESVLRNQERLLELSEEGV